VLDLPGDRPGVIGHAVLLSALACVDSSDHGRLSSDYWHPNKMGRQAVWTEPQYARQVRHHIRVGVVLMVPTFDTVHDVVAKHRDI
jgi:hypothetical protein